jgi:protein SDA1
MGGRGVLLTSNLPQLQNLIKRDPAAYKEEFLQQWNHYDSIRQIFQINPDEQAQHFRELVSFISQVAQCYPKETKDFPSHLSTLLLDNYGTLMPDTRKTLVQNLVMLRNKDVITSIDPSFPSSLAQPPPIYEPLSAKLFSPISVLLTSEPKITN